MDVIPQALVIEDSDTHAYLAITLLKRVGFNVIRIPSLALGIEHANILLNPNQPAGPAIILIDLMLPHERCPVLEGTACIAYLTEQMEIGNLHPAHIIAISSEMNEQRVYEAQVAGSRLAVKKPFTLALAQEVRELVNQNPTLPVEQDRKLPSAESTSRRTLRRILRREATELLHFLHNDPVYAISNRDETIFSSNAQVWSDDAIKTLLAHPQRLLHKEPWSTWIRQHGGIKSIQRRLREVELSSPELQKLLHQVLINEESWRRSADAIGISRNTYFRHLDQVAKELAGIFQTWK